MKKTIIIAALALAIPGVAHAAETPAAQKECCCCKKGEDGKMSCCKDKDAKSSEQGHEGHDMKDMKH